MVKMLFLFVELCMNYQCEHFSVPDFKGQLLSTQYVYTREVVPVKMVYAYL